MIESEKVCKVAIIGAGYTAREHAKAFRDISAVRLEGIYSRTRARAENLGREYGIRKICTSIPELFESTQADLVVVTVSETAILDVCKQCFEYPWTVLMEKPPGLDLGQTLE